MTTTTAMAFAIAVLVADTPFTRLAVVNGTDQTTDTEEQEQEAKIMNDCYGDLTLYRWERVDQTNFPIEDEWRPVMLIADNGRTPLTAVAPGGIYQDTEGSIPGSKKTFPLPSESYRHIDRDHSFVLKISNKSQQLMKDYPDAAKKNIFYTYDDYDCFYIRPCYYQYGERLYEEGVIDHIDIVNDSSDEQAGSFAGWVAGATKTAVAATGSVGVISSGTKKTRPDGIAYSDMCHLDGDRTGFHYSTYVLAMSDGNGGMSDYAFSPSHSYGVQRKVYASDIKTGNSFIDTFKSVGDYIIDNTYGAVVEYWEYYEGSTVRNINEICGHVYFQAVNSWGNSDVKWRLKDDFSIVDDNSGRLFDAVMVNMDGYIAPWPCYTDEPWSDYDVDWYIGKRLHYGSIGNDLTINKDSILPVYANKYINSEGKEVTVDGIIIPEGTTLTVADGGILSIEGTLINNGSIVVNSGGTVIVKNGGTICPYMQGGSYKEKGSGTIKSAGGDILIMPGGTIYGGLNDGYGATVPFELNDNATLINQGLLVYGSMLLGTNARVELYEGSKTYGGFYQYETTNFSCKPDGSDVKCIDVSDNYIRVDWDSGGLSDGSGGFKPFVGTLTGGTGLFGGLFTPLNAVKIMRAAITPVTISDEYNGWEDVLGGRGSFDSNSMTGQYIDADGVVHDSATDPDLAKAKQTMTTLEDAGYSATFNPSDGRIYYSAFEPIEQSEILTYESQKFLSGYLGDIKLLKRHSMTEPTDGMYIADYINANSTKAPRVLAAESAKIEDPQYNTNIKTEKLGL